MGSGGLKETSKLSAKDYQINEYISEGAWGKVYAATHKSTQKRVALKFFG
jgi:serine/threonine protein kinase